MTLSELLLQDWNVYRAQTWHFHHLTVEVHANIPPKRATPELLALMDTMTAWCRARHIEPRLWLFSLFRARQWKFAPKLTEKELTRETNLPKFKHQRGLGFFQRRMAASRRLENSYDPNRDLSPAVEQMKRSLLESSGTQACMADMVGRTMGFHPGSSICQACPDRLECLGRLRSLCPDFDILALRSGALTAEAAEQQAYA